MKANRKERIAVALSGGVDSAVSAALLKKEGYEIAGFFMHNWSEPIDQRGFCPSVSDASIARLVAHNLNIPFYILDFEQEYREKVIKPFLKDYEKGWTPNPDVLCNRFIKFDLFLQKILKLGFNRMATGHYARIIYRKEVPRLFKGLDSRKDQSYFLWTLTENELRKVLFPLGNLEKLGVRKLAEKLGLINAKRPDSQGICFVGEIELTKFLKRFLKIEKGPVRDINGNIMGTHDGVWFYTIGQREGLGISGQRTPLYVAFKEMKTNTLYVVPKDHPLLYSDEFEVSFLSFVYPKAQGTRQAEVVVRYHSQPVKASLSRKSEDIIRVKLETPVRAITEGQSAVFYKGEELLFGGIICNVLRKKI